MMPRRVPSFWSTRWLTRGVWQIVACVAVALALAPAPAFAHAHLQRSAPGAGARLTDVPAEIRLTFSEAPEVAVSSVRLAGPGGAEVPLGTLAAVPGSPRVVVVPIRVPLAAGTYTVTWQVVGDDGHPARGQFSFTIVPGAQGAAGAPPAMGAPNGPPVGPGATGHVAQPSPTPHHAPVSLPQSAAQPGAGFGAESPPYAAIRWLQYVGLLVALGAVAFRYAVVGALVRTRHGDAMLTPALRTGAARLGLGATLVVGVAAVLRLVAQAYALSSAMAGPGPSPGGGLLGAMLLHTVWGWGWLVQAAGVVLAVLGFTAARRPDGGASAGWGLVVLGTAALAVSPALSGHAASAPQWTALTVLADIAHVVGAGGWLGSLLVLLLVGIPAALRLGPDARGPAVADLVNAFSPTALLFAGVVAVTGVFATWVHVGTVPGLWETAYGRTLLVKLALLAVVAALGAYNWRRVRPSLGTVTGAVRLRRVATAELLVGLLVLATTAVLVATPTPMDLRATPQEAAR